MTSEKAVAMAGESQYVVETMVAVPHEQLRKEEVAGMYRLPTKTKDRDC